jgi:hypothetical protein
VALCACEPDPLVHDTCCNLDTMITQVLNGRSDGPRIYASIQHRFWTRLMRMATFSFGLALYGVGLIPILSAPPFAKRKSSLHRDP